MDSGKTVSVYKCTQEATKCKANNALVINKANIVSTKKLKLEII